SDVCSSDLILRVDPGQLGRRAGALARALWPVAPARPEGWRLHGRPGTGARLGREDASVRGPVRLGAARARAPEDRTARDLERAVRAALRPEAGTKVDGANDSDHNRFVAQEATVATSLGPDVRGTLQAGWRRATG